MNHNLRLGFHYHIPAFRNQASLLCMPAYLGRFVDSLAGLCTEVVCFQHSPLPHEEYLMDYAVNSPNITWVDIGPHASVPQRLLRLPGILPLISAWRDRLDGLLLRGPSPSCRLSPGK